MTEKKAAGEKITGKKVTGKKRSRRKKRIRKVLRFSAAAVCLAALGFLIGKAVQIAVGGNGKGFFPKTDTEEAAEREEDDLIRDDKVVEIDPGLQEPEPWDGKSPGMPSQDPAESTVWPSVQDPTGSTGQPPAQDPEMPDWTSWEDNEYVVAIDPGHGGEEESCTGADPSEKERNLSIALLVKQKLKEKGYTVFLTRETEKAVDPYERVRLAADNHADILVSIHQNVSEGNSAGKIATWYTQAKEDTPDGTDPSLTSKRSALSRRLALLLQKNVAGESQEEALNIKEDGQLFITSHSAMPSCLIKTGCLTMEEETQEKIASGIAAGIDSYFHPKTLYLTFDDGPKPGNTEKMLDFLKENGLHATFFLVGKNVKQYPELAKRIADEGHTIGIHSYSHDYNTIYKSVDDFLADFQQAYDAVYEATGVKSWLYRFPGGSVNSYNKDVYDGIVEELGRLGVVYFDWNASMQDAVKNPDAEEILNTAITSARGKDPVVMLAHDVKDTTVECIPRLLDLMPEYRVEPITRDVTPAQFKKK